MILCWRNLAETILTNWVNTTNNNKRINIMNPVIYARTENNKCSWWYSRLTREPQSNHEKTSGQLKLETFGKITYNFKNIMVMKDKTERYYRPQGTKRTINSEIQ